MAQPAKTDLEHKVHGTKSQKRFKREESYLPGGRPKFPKGLTAAGRKTFKTLCGLLEERHALTEGDVEALKLYCILQDRHRRAIERLEVEGEIKLYTRLDSNGQPHQMEKENLWHKVATSCERQMLAILVQLGLTPRSKDSVKPTRRNPESEVVPGSVEDLFGWGSGNVTPIRQPRIDPVKPEDMEAGSVTPE
jgi:P27 family predicted phage terminase small subunit